MTTDDPPDRSPTTDEEGEPAAADRPTSLAEVDRQAVGRVIKCVELKDVRLQHSHTEISAPAVADDWHENAYLLWRTAMVYRENDIFVAAASFLVRFYDGLSPTEQPELPNGEEAPYPDVVVMVDFELFYELQPQADVSERDLHHFCFFNATNNAWGYMREFMQSATARMGIRPFVAPVLLVPSIETPNQG